MLACMADSDRSQSTDRDLPPLPVHPPLPREPPLPGDTDRPHSFRSASSGSRQSSDFRSGRSSLKSFYSEIEFGLEHLQSKLSSETRRADAAERRAEEAERNLQELTEHIKAVNEARITALREAGRANEELKLYRIQLDAAQREIYRAQDIVHIVDRQRYNAEKDAAKSRSENRDLNERMIMQAAKEEAYREGLKEGLLRGRDIAIATMPPEDQYDDYSDSESSRTPSPVGGRRHSTASPPGRPAPSIDPRYGNPPSPILSMRPPPSVKPMSIRSGRSRAPSIGTLNNLPPDARPINMRDTLHMNTNNPSAPGPSHSRASSVYAPPSVHPENTRPPSIRGTPRVGPSDPPPGSRASSIYGPPASVRNMPYGDIPPASRAPSVHPSENMRPSEGPRSRAQSVVGAPAPSVHGSESIRPIRGHSPLPPDNFIPVLDVDNRIRIPPPHEFSRTPERAPSPQLPPMSDSSQEPVLIPPRDSSGIRRGHSRNSSGGSTTSTSMSQIDLINNAPFNTVLRTPMSVIQEVNSTAGSPQVLPPSSERGDATSHRQNRQSMASSYRAPTEHPYTPVDAGMQNRPVSRASYAGSWVEQQAHLNSNSDRNSRISTSTAPNISVQPPSQTSLITDSLWEGDSRAGVSPAPTFQSNLPPIWEGHGQAAPSNAIPGGYGPPSPPGSIPIPDSSWHNPQSYTEGRHNFARDDDAVSSAFSADSLTTPPGRYAQVE